MAVFGWLYRVRMRIAHRLGYCYPEPVAVEPGRVWCHWCGMRGQRFHVTIAELRERMDDLGRRLEENP
jgi:hypothetical protein